MPQVLQAFKNARIIAGDEIVFGSLAADRGLVVAIDAGGEVGEDCEGDILAPGIVDLHTDNLEKHYFPRANIDWDPVSAAIVHDGLVASVGVTTVYDSLSLGDGAQARSEDNQDRLVDGLARAAALGLLRVDHRLHWRCELTAADLRARLDRFAAHPLTGLFSIMDHTPGQRQFRRIEPLLRSWRGEGMEEAAIAARLAEAHARQATYAAAHRRLVSDRARACGVPLAAHDDETPAHVDAAAEAGATIAEFPVTRAAAERARALGMAIVMGGPNLMRGGSYSGNVSAEAIARAGLLDGFASDYVPRSLIECAFRLTDPAFGFSLPRAWATVSTAPARALGLADRGVLTPGRRADVVRIRVVDGRPLVRGVFVLGDRVA